MTPHLVSRFGAEPSRRFRPLRRALAALALLAASAGPASAQYGSPPGIPQNIEGLTVIGKGTVSASPDLAEIDLDVSASAELTGDAIVKFRDAKKRVIEAFEGLKLPNVTVEERGLLVDQKGNAPNPYYVDYNTSQKAKTEVQLSRKLVVKASGLREMGEDEALQLVGRLLDVAQDAGARVGSSPAEASVLRYVYGIGGANPSDLVRFVLEDAGDLQEQAYEKAVADARAKAERLARLGGFELGPVLAVREISAAPAPSRASVFGIEISEGGKDEPVGQRLTNSRLGEIPVRVELQIRFGIQPRVPAQ